MQSSLSILRLAIRDLWRLFLPLLGYDILFRVASALLLAPLTAAILRRLVRVSGRYAVGNLEIAEFLLSPLGLVTLFVSSTLGLLLIYLEHAGFILIAHAAARGTRLTPLGALMATARRLPRVLALGGLQFAILALLAIPFLVPVGIAYATLWSGYDLYYLTTRRPPQFRIGVGIATLAVGGFAVVALRLYLRWLVALPALLIDKVRPAEALRLSADRTRGALRRNLGITVLAIGGVTAAQIVALSAFGMLGDRVLATVDRTPNLIPALAALLAIHVGLASAFSFFSTALNALAILRIDRERRERHSAEIKPADSGREWVPNRPISQIRLILLGGLATLMIVASTISYTLINSLDVRPTIAITAHRGDSSRAPENTLAAIRGAIDAGADYAEIDVQLSSDGVAFVFHDEDLRRIAGDPRGVTSLTYEELRRIDAGSWFDSRFRDEHIPTLEEAIDVAGDRIRLNIELKFPTDRSDPAPLVREVVRIVNANDFATRCVLSSLSFRGLQEVRRQAPELTIGSIVFQAVGDPARLDGDFLSIREAVATDALIAAAHRRGKEVHVWTVDDPDRLLSLLNRGVDNVITDVSAAMVERRAELERLDEFEWLLLAYRERLSWWR